MSVRFIELTRHQAGPVLINPAHIVAIESRRLGGTALPGSNVLVGNAIRFEVREDPGIIRGLIDSLR